MAAQIKNLRLFKERAFINGIWSLGINNATFPVFSPSTGKVVANVADLTDGDVGLCVTHADNAFQKWRKTSVKDRSHFLKQLTQCLLDNEDELATIITIESGKPFQQSKGEVKYSASFLEWFAEEGKRAHGDVLPNLELHRRRLVLKQPVGVCCMITPWNFPLAMITRKVAAAMAAGCTSIVKPSEETPLTALAFAKMVEDTQIPEGVINVITCSQANTESISNILCNNPTVRKLSFTGSTKVGKLLLEKCAPTVKKVSMELGGNAPFIVFDSANVKLAAEQAVESRFRNSGQACTCAERIFVQEGIYDNFMAEFKQATVALNVGDPMNADSQIGALVNASALAKVEEHMEDARSKGADVICGGRQIPKLGSLFFEPTILTNCSIDMLCFEKETFGPVASVMKFKTEKEALRLANIQNSGLTGYVFTNDHNQIWRVSEELDGGMIGVNTSFLSHEMIPFGGVKESGLGREGSIYGINEYLELKHICLGLENMQ